MLNVMMAERPRRLSATKIDNELERIYVEMLKVGSSQELKARLGSLQVERRETFFNDRFNALAGSGQLRSLFEE